MLVVGDLAAAGEIARLDKAVIRQIAVTAVFRELVLEQAKMKGNFVPDIGQRRALRKIVKIHLPAIAVRPQALEDGLHLIRELIGLVIDVAGRGAGMRKEAVGPGLTGRRGMPLVADPEGLCEPADDGDLLLREVMHHRPRIGLRRSSLPDIAVDETVHDRRIVRRSPKPEDLHIDVREKLTGIGIGNASRRRAHPIVVPNRDLVHAAIGQGARIGLVAVETLEAPAFGVELSEHGVERAVLEHENDDVFYSV